MANEANLDSLLDEQLDDLADLPEFKAFPPGAHRCTVKIELKEVNKHPSFELKLTAIETVELANPSDIPLVKGAETSTLFMRDNEIGQGKFKDLMTPIGEKLGTRNLRQIVEYVNQTEFLVITKNRKDKDDKDKLYTDIVKMEAL